MATPTVAVEITEESVRAVEISGGRTPSLVALGEVPLPRDAAKDSEVLDLGAVALALQQLWSTAGIKGKRVTLAVGSRRILVREYTTQAMRPDLLKQALPFQVQDLLPVPANQAVLDFYPLSQVDGQVHGLLVAAVAETVEQLIEAVSRAKVRVDGVDLAPFGLARVAQRVAPQGQPVAMIHIGDHTTHVVVAIDGIPQFVRIIPVDVATSASARHGDEEPAQASILDPSIDGPSAGILPVQSRTQTQTRTRAALREGGAADPGVADLVSRLRGTLAFYENRNGSGPVTQIFASGAGYAAQGVADAMARAFDITVQPVRLEDIVTVKTGALPDEIALNAVSTVGVLLGEGK